MIDTLARHLAALQEARRLLTLVLARNPSFAEWRERSAHAALESDPQLSNDRYYQAFRHVQAAIDLIEPKPEVLGKSGRDLGAQVRLIETLSVRVQNGEKPSSLADALDQAHRELSRRETSPAPPDPTITLGDHETAHTPTFASQAQSSAMTAELAAMSVTLGIEPSSPVPAIMLTPEIDQNPRVVALDPKSQGWTAPAVKPETIHPPQAAARIVNDSLVYAAPKWTEASVEIVRAPIEPARAPVPPVPSTRRSWFRRMASAS
ncbi:MAG: hypothetical protein K2Y05_08675 [Hyphomicrobiaceae bacterium]|nr:hypothetical protein [Hyphomicrobiaceae bacterium]